LILDDIERLIPAELEHADSTRSRQIAEVFLHIARPAIYRHAITLIASAPAAESLHSVLANGFIFRETVTLKAPNKEARRTILETVMDEEGLKGDVDSLEVAGMTDGYLPGDLHALIERARQESIVRAMSKMELAPPESSEMSITTGDFESAVKGYVPASLRGVKLQKSTVDWNDIGGTLCYMRF
jgi:peroxin-1